MAKMIKDSEQIIVSCSLDGKTNKVMFYVKHKDVTEGQIPVDELSIGVFMKKMAEKKMFCKTNKCKLGFTKWEQVMS